MLKVAAVVVAGSLVSLAPAIAGEPPVRPALVVRVYNAVGVNDEDLARARDTVRGIFAHAGIDAVWQDCNAASRAASPDGPCDHSRQPDEVLVRIVAASPEATTDALGFSAVVVGQPSGSLATVLADRVAQMAGRTHADQGQLLGKVIAHEIGHLLLGTNDHSAAGLMRARWKDEEVGRDRPTDWLLSRAEARHLRLAVADRSKAPERPLVHMARAAR